MRLLFFVFKQKTAYELRMSDWSSDVCSSDLFAYRNVPPPALPPRPPADRTSRVQRCHAPDTRGRVRRFPLPLGPPPARLRLYAMHHAPMRRLPYRICRTRPAKPEDRKSTGLNSSH